MGCANRKSKYTEIEDIYLKPFEKKFKIYELNTKLLKRLVRSLKNANYFDYSSIKAQSNSQTMKLFDNPSFINYLEDKEFLNIYTYFIILSLYCSGTPREKASLLFLVYTENGSREISRSSVSDLIRNMISFSSDIVPSYVLNLHSNDEELKSYVYNIRSVVPRVSVNNLNEFMKNRATLTKVEFIDTLSLEYGYLLKPKWARIYNYEIYYASHIYQEIDYILIVEYLNKNFRGFKRRIIKKPSMR